MKTLDKILGSIIATSTLACETASAEMEAMFHGKGYLSTEPSAEVGYWISGAVIALATAGFYAMYKEGKK